MHDAVEDVCDRLLRADNPVPDAGGTPATVIITIDLDDLLANTGYGIATDGTLIATDTVRHLTDSAEIYTAFLTRHGEVLRLGRSRRIASRSQTIALIARDIGCSFPGCDAPAEWSERHHIVAWIDGGKTDLNNLTLLCRYHHHNFAQQRLGLPHQRRRTPRMVTTLVDRQDPYTHDQHPDPRHPRCPTPPTAVDPAAPGWFEKVLGGFWRRLPAF